MADDHYSRSPRPNAPFARPQTGPRPPQPGGDPLAELARLIGQGDPYAGYGQTSSRPASGAPAHDPRYGRYDEETNWRAPDTRHAPQDPYAQQPGYQDGYDANASHAAPSSYPDYQDPHYAPPQHGYGDPNYERGYGEQNYNPPYYGDHPDQRGAAQHDHGYAPQSYVDPQYSERTQDPRYADQQGVPQFASPQYDDKPYPAYDNQLYAKQQAPAFAPVAPHADAYAAPNGQAYPGPYYDDPNSPTFGAPYYQHDVAPETEEAPARRRGGLVTVLAVLALAVVGTAAAFGYRAIFAPAGTRVPPPVIKADTAPSKIVPAGDAKPIQDRVGDRAQIERIINREEQPVDVNAARAGAPRVVFPGGPNPIAPLPNSPIPPSPNAVAQAPAPAGSAAPATSEPKKIRTVTIRSDQPELAGAAQATAAAPASRTANVPSGVLPDDTAARSHASASASGPLSLAPNSAAQPAQRSAPSRTAALPATPPAATAGGYSVQVTSQRSEADAQAAFAQLQAKFPSVLGNRQVVIRRADLGEKGIYFRAQIPFGSQSEAAEFCTSLRSAGGQCMVQRN